MIINTNEISAVNVKRLFKKYNVSGEDLEYYKQLIKIGNVQEAIDEFIEKYTKEPTEKYNNLIRKYLRESEKGEISAKDKNRIERNIVLLSIALSSLQSENIKNFIRDSFSPVVYDKYNITSPKSKRAILDATLKQFELLTSNSLTNTQANVLSNIRKMQKEMIIFNQGLARQPNLSQNAINNQIKAFKNGLQKTMPSYYKGLDEGKIIIGKDFKHYKLDSYIENSVRNTLLNVDRTVVEVGIRIQEEKKKDGGVPVVDYYLRDNRTLKTGIEREICKSVLRQKLFGKSLVALNQDTANLLGIPTLESIKVEGAMGNWCRHSLRPVSSSIRKKLNGMLRNARREVANA